MIAGAFSLLHAQPHAIVFHRDHDVIFPADKGNDDRSRSPFRLDPVKDGVFHQRLYDQLRADARLQFLVHMNLKINFRLLILFNGDIALYMANLVPHCVKLLPMV